MGHRPLPERMADNMSSDADGPSDVSPCGEDSFSIEMTENNGTQMNDKKKKNSITKSLRESIRQVRMMSFHRTSPTKSKESDSKIERTNTGNDLGNSSDDAVQSPTSPSKYHISKVL